MPNVVATAAGYSSLSAGVFNGEAWSTVLNWKYYEQSLVRAITNSRWEGEVKLQGTVNIRNRPDIVVNSYQRGAKINYQNIDDSLVQLKTDQAELAAWTVDEIDLRQTNIDIQKELTFDASQMVSDAVDINVLANIYPDATSSITQSVINKVNVLEWLAVAYRKLSKLKVPKRGRWVVLPPEIIELISISDLKNASLSGHSSTIIDGIALNGKIVMKVAGFDVYESNNVAFVASVHRCIAGHPTAVAFANSFQKSKKIDLIDSVGEAIQSLNVYGFKTTKGDALVDMPATV